MQKEPSVLIPKNLLSVREEGRKCKGEMFILEELQPSEGVSNSFSPGGHISLMVAFKGPNVILGLCKCNYSLTVKRELGAVAR